MSKRFKLSKSDNRKIFRKGASRVHGKNYNAGPMRGGIRL